MPDCERCLDCLSLFASRSCAFLYMRRLMTVNTPLRSVTSAASVTWRDVKAVDSSAAEQRARRANSSAVPHSFPERPASCIAHKRSNQMPRVAGAQRETAWSFIQSPV